MIPYYSPHFGFYDLIKTIICRDADERLKAKFRELTGKKYILITSSCRSALYLAYKAIGVTGIVHTSPMTCKVALLPIIASGNNICFHDVRVDDWTLDADSITLELSDSSIAIQAIHLGGFPCDMPALRKVADDNKLLLIEDCAQGYGAKYKGVETGTLGDIACFTLTKNLYSLGGGVLATDNENWYLVAKREQEAFPKQSTKKTFYRIALALLTTYRYLSLCEAIYQILKKRTNRFKLRDELADLHKELREPLKIYAKSLVSRWEKVSRLVRVRQKIALMVLDELQVSEGMKQHNHNLESSYTKLFIKSNGKSPEVIQNLNLAGIEAMHLEHKHKVVYQAKLLGYGLNKCGDRILNSYDNIHDHIISLPLQENLRKNGFTKFVSSAKRMIN